MDTIGSRDMAWSAGVPDIVCLPQSASVRKGDGDGDDDDDNGKRMVPCSTPTVPLAEELQVTESSVDRVVILVAADSLDAIQLLRSTYAQHAAKQAHTAPRPGGRPPPPVPFDEIEDTIVVRPALAPLPKKPSEGPGRGNVNVKPRAPRYQAVAKRRSPSRRRQIDDEMEEVIHVRSAPVTTPMEDVIVVRYPERRSSAVDTRPRGRKPLHSITLIRLSD